MILGAGLVLGAASGASGQERAGPRIPDAQPGVEWSATAALSPAAPAVAAPRTGPVAATVSTENAARPGATSRWLMVGGGALLAAALGDYLMDDVSFGLSDRSALAYGAGLALFGVGAWQTATAAPAAPPVLATSPGDPGTSVAAPRR